MLGITIGKRRVLASTNFSDPRSKKLKDAMANFLESNSIQACLIWDRYYDLQGEASNLLNEEKNEKMHLIIYNFLRIADYSKRISDLVP